MLYSHLRLLIAALLAGNLTAQQTPKFGTPAPELSLDLLQAPSGTQPAWTALRGNAVVLEFWATWCSGCIAQIPYLNTLAAKFKNSPVRFISITDEEKELVQRFLSKRPISGWIGLDRQGTTFRNFGIEPRPVTALIDANGVLRSMQPPDSVDEKTIEALIAGNLPVAAQPLSVPRIGSEANAPAPVFQALIRPALPNSGMSSGARRLSAGKWEAWGLTIRALLAEAYSIPSLRILALDWCDGAKFDVILPASGDEEQRLVLLRQAIGMVFTIKEQRETREVEVWILRKFDNRTPSLRQSEFGKPVRLIVSDAEFALNRPVLDETGLTGKYDYDPKWRAGADTVQKAAAEKFGLELVPARRMMEVLVVEPLKPE